jgi:two-component system, LytTR family, response regulator
MKPVRALIIDDEPLGRERVRMLLAEHPHVSVVGECADGRSAVAAIRTHRPDLVFLDIRMPELDGFEVLDALDGDALPNVIFVTAFDEYAIRAFEVNAVDYLLKPIDPARLAQSIERVEKSAGNHGDERLLAVLEMMRRPAHRSRIVVRDSRGAFFLPTTDILWLEAAGNYVRVHAAKGAYLVRETLKELEKTLDPERFVRVHRSAVVNLDAVERVEPWKRGEYAIVLRDGTRLVSSRTFGNAFRAMLE